MSDTVDVHQASDILKVHPETVLDLIADGAIPAAKVGRAYVMLHRDVMAYVTSLIIKQTAARLGGGPVKQVRRRRVLPQLVG